MILRITSMRWGHIECCQQRIDYGRRCFHVTVEIFSKAECATSARKTHDSRVRIYMTITWNSVCGQFHRVD
jgi:hypothetical protein